MWAEALDNFLNYFEPCTDWDESSHQFTTRQLTRMLEQHCGLGIDAAALTTHLQEKGFKYQYDLDLTFHWLFKQKTITR